MKSTRVNYSTFLIKKDDGSEYTLVLSSDQNQVIIEFQTKEISYKSKFTMEKLIEVSKQFKLFQTPRDVVDDENGLKNLVGEGLFKFRKDGNKFALTFTLNKRDITLIIGMNCLEQIKIKKVFNAHNGPINNICILKDGRLASCSGDKTIKIFSLSSYQCDIVITGHGYDVLYISTLDNGNLISASRDRSIRIWGISEKNYKCLKILSDLSNYPWKVLQLSNNRIGCCLNDGNLVIFDSTDYKKLKVLQKHSSYAFSLIELKSKKFLVTGGFEGKVIFWDNVTYEPNHIIEEVKCCDSNSLIEIGEDKIVVGGNKVTVINSLRFEIEKIVDLDEGVLVHTMIELGDGSILCGGGQDNDGMFIHLASKEYNVLNLKNKIHEKSIKAIILMHDDRIITCSGDETIKIWK